MKSIVTLVHVGFTPCLCFTPYNIDNGTIV